LLAPRLEDAATFRGDDVFEWTAGVKAWHARRAEALAVMAGAGAGTATAAPPASDAIRIRRALELAWYRVLSGGSRKSALEKLDKEPIRRISGTHSSGIAAQSAELQAPWPPAPPAAKDP
jgi:hypothetical protein